MSAITTTQAEVTMTGSTMETAVEIPEEEGPMWLNVLERMKLLHTLTTDQETDGADSASPAATPESPLSAPATSSTRPLAVDQHAAHTVQRQLLHSLEQGAMRPKFWPRV